MLTEGKVWFRSGHPISLAGRAYGGYSVRYSVSIPPSGGIDRARALLTAGQQHLSNSRRQYGTALALVSPIIKSQLPSWTLFSNPYASPNDERWLERAESWKECREALNLEGQSHRIGHRVLDMPLSKETLRSREYAQAALKSAVAAFNNLEEIDLASDAHEMAHQCGDFLAGLYGCSAEFKDGRWFDVCQLSLMHLRVGLSAGFSGRRYCSICREDFMECIVHFPNTKYPVVAAENSEGCTICWAPRCVDHKPGKIYHVESRAILKKADLSEVSIVPVPRDPEARIQELEILPTELPVDFRHNDSTDLACTECLQPCSGFTSCQEATGRETAP